MATRIFQPAPVPAKADRDPPPAVRREIPRDIPRDVPPEEPTPQTGPLASDYTTVWVHRRNVAAVNNKTRWVRVTRTAAAALVAAGQAQYVDGSSGRLKYVQGCEPRGWPPTTPAFAPQTVAVTSFTAANPPLCMANGVDIAKLKNGDALRLTATAGDTAARAIINGKLCGVMAINVPARTFLLAGINLVGATVAGLTATGVTEQPAA